MGFLVERVLVTAGAAWRTGGRNAHHWRSRSRITRSLYPGNAAGAYPGGADVVGTAAGSSPGVPWGALVNPFLEYGDFFWLQSRHGGHRHGGLTIPETRLMSKLSSACPGQLPGQNFRPAECWIEYASPDYP